METRIRCFASRLAVALAVVAFATIAATLAQAQQRAKFSTLHHFRGGAGGGQQPIAELTPDGLGGFYGPAAFGGPDDVGLAFQLKPPLPAETRWTLDQLHKFKANNRDGRVPNTPLVGDGSGARFGTTFVGGTAGRGTVFMLTPPVVPGDPWTETILYSFVGGVRSGERPQGQLAVTPDGDLLGTAYLGGSASSGIIFLLTPAGPGDPWTFRVIHSFDGVFGGSFPQGGLTADDQGIYYGMTTRGGTNDRGTVYSLRPPASADQRAAGWRHTVLFSFPLGSTSSTGGVPIGNLLVDDKGALYGTTQQGGTADLGTVFKLAREGTPRTWQYHVLHSFGVDAADGTNPLGTLIADSNKNLYGTTKLGGTADNGIVFKLKLPPKGVEAGTETVLHRFAGPDGSEPQAGVIMDGNGILYGTTSGGGKFSRGTVFSLQP